MQTPQIPIIIDVESSGFGRGSYPIEIGVALPDGSTHCYLIKPLKEWDHWSEESEQIHHISRDILRTRGREITDVADALNQLLAGETVYSDGWGMDNSWIARLFDSAQRIQKFRVAQLQGLFNEQQYDNWHQLHQQVIDEFNITRHRASSDALLIQKTFLLGRG